MTSIIERTVKVSLPSLLLLSTFGCAGPRMVPPNDISTGARVLEVQNRSSATGSLVNEDFDLGSYKVAEVDRDWGKKSSVGIGGYKASSTKTGYSFRLEAASSWEGRCSSLNREKSAGSISWGGQSRLICECRLPAEGDSTKSAVLELDGKDPKNHDQGKLNWDGQEMVVQAVTDTDKTNLTGAPAGYRVDSDGTPLAAVETLRPGRMWIGGEVGDTETEMLSCIFAGVMLYVPPSDF